MLERLSPRTILCGHYGSGKTNLTVNLALLAARAGEKVTVVDMDIVNPYFRTADFRELFRNTGVGLIAPLYAGTNLDIPVLPPSVRTLVRSGAGRVFLDLGGDDDGAVALGGFSADLKAVGYTMVYVVNSRREPDPDPGEEASLLARIQAVSRLEVTWLVNNTNLGCDPGIPSVFGGGVPAHRSSYSGDGGGGAFSSRSWEGAPAAGEDLC